MNNAGQVFPGGLDESDPAGFEASVAVNLTQRVPAGGRVPRRTSPRASLDGGASVVNLASMSSYFGIEIVPGYGAAKTGILGMTRTLADEVGEATASGSTRSRRDSSRRT